MGRPPEAALCHIHSIRQNSICLSLLSKEQTAIIQRLPHRNKNIEVKLTMSIVKVRHKMLHNERGVIQFSNLVQKVHS